VAIVFLCKIISIKHTRKHKVFNLNGIIWKLCIFLSRALELKFIGKQYTKISNMETQQEIHTKIIKLQ
jgi:hypothetical protein